MARSASASRPSSIRRLQARTPWAAVMGFWSASSGGIENQSPGISRSRRPWAWAAATLICTQKARRAAGSFWRDRALRPSLVMPFSRRGMPFMAAEKPPMTARKRRNAASSGTLRAGPYSARLSAAVSRFASAPPKL